MYGETLDETAKRFHVLQFSPKVRSIRLSARSPACDRAPEAEGTPHGLRNDLVALLGPVPSENGCDDCTAGSCVEKTARRFRGKRTSGPAVGVWGNGTQTVRVKK